MKLDNNRRNRQQFLIFLVVISLTILGVFLLFKSIIGIRSVAYEQSASLYEINDQLQKQLSDDS